MLLRFIKVAAQRKVDSCLKMLIKLIQCWLVASTTKNLTYHGRNQPSSPVKPKNSMYGPFPAFFGFIFPLSWVIVRLQLINFTMVNVDREQERRRKSMHRPFHDSNPASLDKTPLHHHQHHHHCHSKNFSILVLQFLSITLMMSKLAERRTKDMLRRQGFLFLAGHHTKLLTEGYIKIQPKLK